MLQPTELFGQGCLFVFGVCFFQVQKLLQIRIFVFNQTVETRAVNS